MEKVSHAPTVKESLTVQSTVTEFDPDYPRCWCGECLAEHWRQRPCLRREIARCDAELARIGEAQASGHPDGIGLLMAEADWRIERQMIEKEKHDTQTDR